MSEFDSFMQEFGLSATRSSLEEPSLPEDTNRSPPLEAEKELTPTEAERFMGRGMMMNFPDVSYYVGKLRDLGNSMKTYIQGEEYEDYGENDRGGENGERKDKEFERERHEEGIGKEEIRMEGSHLLDIDENIGKNRCYVVDMVGLLPREFSSSHKPNGFHGVDVLGGEAHSERNKGALDLLASNVPMPTSPTAVEALVYEKTTQWKGNKPLNIRGLLLRLDANVWPAVTWQRPGITDLATDEQVKNAYKTAIARMHPDKWQKASAFDREMANAVFCTLQEAYEKTK